MIIRQHTIAYIYILQYYNMVKRARYFFSAELNKMAVLICTNFQWGERSEVNFNYTHKLGTQTCLILSPPPQPHAFIHTLSHSLSLFSIAFFDDVACIFIHSIKLNLMIIRIFVYRKFIKFLYCVHA